MITIITALYTEAKPFLEHLQLKKNTSEPLLTLFEGQEIRVLITGVGPMAACMAVTRYCALFPPAKTDLAVNIGLAGCIAPVSSGSSPASGSCLLAVKLLEGMTGRTFYPDLLYQNDFAKAQLVTAPFVVTETSAEDLFRPALLSDAGMDFTETEYSLPLLVDMEASSVYQSLLPYFSVERMVFLKVVSDRIAWKENTQKEVTDTDRYEAVKPDTTPYAEPNATPYANPDSLIAPHLSAILTFLGRVQAAVSMEPSNHPVNFSDTEQSCIDRLLKRLPMTAAMRHELLHLLRYAKLCVNSVEGLLNDFLQTLPAEPFHGKKQGKPYFDRLANQILKSCSETASADRPTNPPPLSLAVPEASYLPFFSSLYIEKELWTQKEHLIPSLLLSRNRSGSERDLTVIPTRHYKDVFNRSRQSFAAQKHSPALILANNHGTLLYPGAPVCQNFGNQHFYYTSNVMNCIYHCDYCYLQGMYPSGHVVAFLNLEDYFAEVTKLLSKHPVYLCISYDTDLLALEPLFHFAEQWIRFARNHLDLTLEIRTKSGNPALFPVLREAWDKERQSLPFNSHSVHTDVPLEHQPRNIVFAWTVSPDSLARSAEHGATPLPLRLKALAAAKASGFSVRLCFDPMICFPGWQEAYRELVQHIFEPSKRIFSPADLTDVSIGVFRISTEYLKAMRKKRPDSPIVQFPYVTENGVSHYGSLSEKMVQYLYELLLPYVPAERIFLWNGT